MKALLFASAVALGLAGCGSEDRSAGGSSYETENAVTATLRLPDGRPATRAVVRARPLGWLSGQPVDSSFDLRSGSDGRIALRLPAGAWRLEARQEGLVALLEVPAQRNALDLGPALLAAPVSIVGRATPGATIGASGLQHHAVVDAGGGFRIDSLPAGLLVLRERGTSARAFVEAKAGEVRDAGILRADSAGQIFLDDFEDGDSRLRHGAWTGGGWWWVAADSGINLSPDGADRDPSLAVFADGGGGKVFHFSAAFPAGADATAWAQCGVDFGTRPLDLSGLVAIRFRARGIGSTTVVVNLDAATPAEVPQASFALDSLWKEFEIPVAALQLPSWSGSTLDSAARVQCLRRATGLTWSRASSGDIWLDDIRLVGPSPALLWGKSPPP